MYDLIATMFWWLLAAMGYATVIWLLLALFRAHRRVAARRRQTRS